MALNKLTFNALTQKPFFQEAGWLNLIKNNMRILKKVLVFALTFFGFELYSQAIIVSPVYTACPNQTIMITPQWNNVGGVNYFLQSPNGGNPASGALGPVGSFTISCAIPTATSITYTLSGTGNGQSGAVTSTVFFNLNIVPPAPLTITNQIFYCPGQTATLTAPIGGFTYDLNGPINQLGNTSNIITIANLPATGGSGVYTITSIGSCTAYGTTTISVAPSTPLAINATSNVCQCTAVNLTSALNLGVNFQWYSPINQALCNTPNCLLACPQASDSGVYTAYAELPWGVVSCPRTATTLVNVVQTNPVAAAASPGSYLCQGDKLSFSAVAGGAVGWTWNGPQAFAASISNPTINPVGPTNGGNYTVTALFTNNIITCSTSAVVTVSVITVNQPVINMPSSVCQNATISISAQAAGATSYNWFGPNSFSPTASSTIIPNIQTNGSGIYYVTARFGSPSTATCASSNSTQLNVVPVNTVTVIPPSQVCQPNNGQLQCSAIGANSYTWVGPGGFSAPGPNATVYYPTPNSSGIYTVTAAFSGGNITCLNTNTVQLTVNPILSFSLIPRQQACYNTPLGVLGPAGATSYTWSSSNGFSSNSKDINFPSVQPNNSGTYTLNVSLGPCITSASTTIEVLTPVQFTLVPHSREICKGDTTVLEAGVTGGSQNYAYIWNPSVYLENPIGPKKVAVPLGSVIYNVIAHDIACPNYTIAQSFSVNVNQPPVPTLILDKTSGCVPLTVEFNPQFTSPSAITTYDFGGLQRLQRDGKFSLNFPSAGTYSFTVYTKGINGCSGEFAQPYPIEVFPKPVSSISWEPQNPTTTDEIVFSSSAVNGPLINKTWSFSGGKPTIIDTSIVVTNGSDTSNADYPVRIYEFIGKYPLMLISKNEKECSDTVVKYISITDDFRIYIPNTFTPNDDGVNDLFGVKGSGIKLEGFTFEVTDRWGDVIFSTKDILEWWDGKYKGNPVKTGTYIYRVRAVGLNGEGRREIVNYFNLVR
ncbi:MAG: gliding motility-associated C-terminal domain-containing protein [Bacteroidia bacterium]|nr:gliding motility-associated C-terminal domain-containing protein [Bacteroidia bacterium]